MDTTLEPGHNDWAGLKFVPELGIPDDADASTKVRKLAAAVCASKEKVNKVTFDLQMQIAEMQLNVRILYITKQWNT